MAEADFIVSCDKKYWLALRQFQGIRSGGAGPRKRMWSLADFREWTKRALQVVRDLPRTFPRSGDLVWRATAAERFKAAQLDQASRIGMFVTQRSAERVFKK